MTEPVDALAARAVAVSELIRLAASDSTLSEWASAAAGSPVLVHTFSGEPSYWIVPIEPHDAVQRAAPRLAGFVRVSLTGRVLAAGKFGGLTRVVTGITQEEARAKAGSAGVFREIGTPLFIHDGPPGREGWRVDVMETNGERRALFVTAAGVTEPKGSSDIE
jgi:hypothetical protein